MEFLQSFLRLLASRNVGCYLRLGKLLSNKFHFNRRTLLYISLSSHTFQTPLYSRHLCFSSAVINIVDFSLTALSLGLHEVFNDFLWNQKSIQCKKVNINFETCGTSCPAHTTSRYWVISSHDTSIEWNCHRRKRGFRINTYRFPKQAPKLLGGYGVMLPQEIFWILTPSSPLSWVSESFRWDIGQFNSPRIKYLSNPFSRFQPGKFFSIKNIFIMKNLIDFRKTLETGLGPRPETSHYIFIWRNDRIVLSVITCF